MRHNSHSAGIYGNPNIFPQDFNKHEQFDHNSASSELFNPIQNTPPSSCLTTLDSSSIPHEFDTTCSILTSHYPNTPQSSSYFINQTSTNSTPSSCSEILINDIHYQILKNSIATYLPSINYSSTSSYTVSEDVRNERENSIQQEMNLDQNRSQFTEANFPNLMINDVYQPWFQSSQIDQQQRMGLMQDSNFPYYGSALIGSGFAENALVMEMGIQDGLLDIPTESDQINKLPDQGIVDRVFERKQNRKLKNREAAARSRVKKQEYVNNLETKCCRLKEDNDLLNKELVFLRSISRRRHQLRRTSSCEIIEKKKSFLNSYHDNQFRSEAFKAIKEEVFPQQYSGTVN